MNLGLRHADAVGSWRRCLPGGCMSVVGPGEYLHIIEVNVASARSE